MQPTYTLVMDTSSSPLLLGLEKDGKLCTARRKGIKQERILFPLLQRLLTKQGGRLADISRLFLIRGPGRFTGIRIALTLGSMLQFLNRTEVYGATLFDVLYRQAIEAQAYKLWKKRNPAGVIAVVLHAFREEYFLQIFDDKHSRPQWLSRQDLLTQLAAIPVPLFLVGTGKDFSPLTDLVGNTYAVAPYVVCRVRPQTLVCMAQESRWKEQALEPLYLKPARFELEEPK